MEIRATSGQHDLTACFVAHQLWKSACHVEKTLEVDARVEPHLRQHVDRIFTANIATGTRRVRTSYSSLHTLNDGLM